MNSKTSLRSTIELPPLMRRIRAVVQTYGRDNSLRTNVYKLGKQPNVSDILKARDWRIVKTTRNYIYAEAPRGAAIDGALYLEIDVPTRDQVLNLARSVYAESPTQPWWARWGEWIVRYHPRTPIEGQKVDPFTGDRGLVEQCGFTDAHLVVGAHGLFDAAVTDIGGMNRYSESFVLAPAPEPSLFDQPGDPALVDEVSAFGPFIEGDAVLAAHTRYERCPAARAACIEHWGVRCCVCGFDFEAVYGELGAGFIEVHHVTPLAQIGGAYEVDPIQDLRPLCSNCHAMIHRQEPPLTPEALRHIVETGHQLGVVDNRELEN